MQTRKRKINTKRVLIVSIVITLVLGLTLGFAIGKMTGTKKVITDDESIYTKLYEIIESNYLDTTGSEESLEDRLLSGMVSGLDDPYSSYMNSAAYDSFVSSINGNLKGIGVAYIDYGIGAVLTEVYNDSPAYNAGLEAGDLITEINGTALVDNEDKTIRELLQEKDTAELTYYRKDKKYEKKIKLEEITIDVSYEIKDDNIGYIRVSTFGDTTASNIEKALKYFNKNNITTVCLDLRNNSGGYLASAQGVLNLFIPSGMTMFQTQNDKGKTDYKSDDSTKYVFDQGFILVNNGTASASEVVTSSLSEVLNYQIIGETTYGKGVVQTPIALSSTQTVKLTTAKWLTPNGNSVSDVGITPHYEVNATSLYDYAFEPIDEDLEYDDVDTRIIYAQKALKTLGYKVDRTDGYFSKKTATCIKQFEKDHNMVMNGRLNNKIAILLFSELGNYYKTDASDQVYTKMKELIK